ncbi:MAG: HPP family protein [Alphaproteobacteria bacterium]|nr:HPP family protein [Alphaproteobacteria bacterium]
MVLVKNIVHIDSNSWRLFFVHFLGIEFSPVSSVERLISLVGGALSIFMLYLATDHILGAWAVSPVLGSMGASAVLVFGVPRGALSQPWPLVGGHLISAAIGVTCARFISSIEFSAACAVGLAIGAMHYLRCLHPPGGATALIAVSGGQVYAASVIIICWPLWR